MSKKYYEYDSKKRKLAKTYSKVHLLAGILNNLVVPIVSLYILHLSGVFSHIQNYIVAVFFLASMIFLLQLPLSFYIGYVYEHKHKLSTQNKASWIVDYSKYFMISFVVLLMMVTGLYSLAYLPYWWVFAAGAYFIFELMMDYVFPLVIIPLFYNLKPYKSRYTENLRKICESMKIDKIWVADESKRSVKANAFIAGLGNTKKIVIFDTLLSNFTKDEVETVIGHEIGHHVNKDILKSILMKSVIMVPLLFAVNQIVLISGNNISSIAALPIVLLSYTLLDFLVEPIMNVYSRRCEMQADLFALKTIGKPDAQISCEKRFCDLGLDDDKPNRIIEFFFHSHPSSVKRINMCKEWNSKWRA